MALSRNINGWIPACAGMTDMLTSGNMCYNARRKTMTAEGHPLKNRIAGIINRLNNGMHEREETIAVSLLAALAGQNAFLLGPPGTAKSLIARRIACAFAEKESDIKFFAYLMQRFSTPDEVFGPISVQKLKEDIYFRQTDRFLPWAEFAFLDEIWKASPAILNTLLTIVNERIFRNGATEDRVSLKALIAASNETPPDGQGLEALYDRFIVRLHVPPMRDPGNFVKLLSSPQVKSRVNDVGNLAISTKEWDEWREGIQKVQLSPETTNVVMLIKNKLDKNAGKKSGVYVSDRRWQKAMLIVKAAAFFCDRHQTNLADALLLRHCLWTTDKNRDTVIEIVEKAVKESGLSTGRDFGELVQQKEKLHAKIKKALFHDEDVYETENLGGMECHKAVLWHGSYYTDKQQDIYMPASTMSASAADKKWYPLLDEDCNINKNLLFQAAGNASVRINVAKNHGHYHQYISLRQNDGGRQEQVTCSLKVLFRKGTKIRFDSPGTRQILTEKFRGLVEEMKEQFREIKDTVQNQREAFRQELDSPFDPEEKSKIALEGVDNQLREIDAALQDCEHMYALAKD